MSIVDSRIHPTLRSQFAETASDPVFYIIPPHLLFLRSTQRPAVHEREGPGVVGSRGGGKNRGGLPHSLLSTLRQQLCLRRLDLAERRVQTAGWSRTPNHDRRRCLRSPGVSDRRSSLRPDLLDHGKLPGLRRQLHQPRGSSQRHTGRRGLPGVSIAQ